MDKNVIATNDEGLIALLDAWHIPSPRRLRPTDAGTNNLSRFVDTPGGSYFLRIYQNLRVAERARYEHRLLLMISTAGIPFQVPVPVATGSGDTLVSLGPPDHAQFAALFTMIAGRHPVHGNLFEAELVGAALANLHRALATLDLPAPPGHAMYGDFDRVHSLVPDLWGAITTLPVPTESRQRAERIFRHLSAVVPSLYATLPRQIIHADFGRGNVLIENGRVSGILDFEFAGPDLRAIDLACGIWSFSVYAWGSGQEWPIIRAFLKSYRSVNSLDRAELDALPTLLRLRQATSLIHWIGRWRQRLTGAEDMGRRVEDLLFVEDWT